MNHWRPQRSRTGNEGWLTSYADLITNLLIFFVLIISASQIQSGKMERIISSMSAGQPTSTTTLSQAKKELNEVLKEQQLDRQVTVQMTDEGLELSFESGVMFASGSAEIFSAMNEPLGKVLTAVAKYREKYRYAVEGHTDEIPIRSGTYLSNWELSSARALAVRQRLEDVGIKRDRIRVEAYADTRPLPAKATQNLSREELLAKHRRVVIRLY